MRNENTCLHKNMWINVCGNIVLNSQKTEQPKCPSTEQSVVYPYIRKLFSQDEVLTRVLPKMNLTNIVLHEGSQS